MATSREFKSATQLIYKKEITPPQQLWFVPAYESHDGTKPSAGEFQEAYHGNMF